MTVYILHLNQPLAHSSHYVGWAKRLSSRLMHHQQGRGSRFTQACIEAGISWQLARVWHRANRKFERKLKDTHSVKDYCPVCMGEAVIDYHPRKVKHAKDQS